MKQPTLQFSIQVSQIQSQFEDAEVIHKSNVEPYNWENSVPEQVVVRPS